MSNNLLIFYSTEARKILFLQCLLLEGIIINNKGKNENVIVIVRLFIFHDKILSIS